MKLVIKRITLSTIHEYDFLKRYIIASLSLSLGIKRNAERYYSPRDYLRGLQTY